MTTAIKTIAQKGMLLGATTALAFSAVAPMTATSVDAQSNRRYVVTVQNPVTRKVETRTRPLTTTTANRTYRSYRRTHYAIFRYAGINETTRTKRFSTQRAAQRYLDTNGPCRDANALNLCVIDMKKLRPAIVRKTLFRPDTGRRIYYITIKNPITGSIERRIGPYSRRTLTTKYRAARKNHYAVYRYAGIGEQMKTKRFSTKAAAQRYLRTNGPCRDANALGICLLDRKFVRPAIVRTTTRR
ncbi:hypothetical protein IQ266_23325 [filamentous cyanobacterium LEGE 11480]|uniref:Uncharacterized protein n=1 Tax=Romeriopsis navalis LEGE 11480 TaxID=2777977 RepID=A0A928Z648_9CYAN|nr:hypothetical protein [Romeriopsis navalis]MBE9032672.1 hypothetical protein [Romeriopsis navalis LEGE 11480]